MTVTSGDPSWAGAELIERLERLPNEPLRDPSHAYPVVEWLPAPGWSHEEDHAREIRRR